MIAAMTLLLVPFVTAYLRAIDITELGLTNQLFDIAVALVYACNYNFAITVPNVTLDLGKNIKGHLEDIIDIEETNMLIRCTKIVPFRAIKHPANIKHLSPLHMGKWSDLKTVSFLKSVRIRRDIRSRLYSLPKAYYGLHFRLESDVAIFMCRGMNAYHAWLKHQRKEGFQVHAVDPHARSWALCMIKEYMRAVSSMFSNQSLPIVISSGLGKHITENLNMEWSLTLFRKNVNRLIIINEAYFKYRELNAAADLVVMRRAIKFIGVSTSTFSTFLAKTIGQGASSLIPGQLCTCRSHEARLLSSFSPTLPRLAQ